MRDNDKQTWHGYKVQARRDTRQRKYGEKSMGGGKIAERKRRNRECKKLSRKKSRNYQVSW